MRRNTMEKRYLTKSLFQLAMECPEKLYFTGKDEYVNNQLADPFLQALAEGGFQVGELAKLYYPGGYTVDTQNYEDALAQTNALLEKENCIIFEAAIKYENLFVRVDILEKIGNTVRLIEVKSSSITETTDAEFMTKGGKIAAEWVAYVHDIAFQKYVTDNAMPDYHIIPYLMLVDKNAVAPTDGLNQKFKLMPSQCGRKYAVVAEEITAEDLSEKLLIPINTQETCAIVYEADYEYLGEQVSFSELVHRFADQYQHDRPIAARISPACKTYEFKASKEEREAGLKSGFHERWKRELGWDDSDFDEGTIFDIWDFRKIPTYLRERKIKLSQLTKEDIDPKADDRPGLSRTERQWLQVEKSQNNDASYWIDKENLKKEMASWTYPLHFIDFETAMPAVPFNKGRRPYEGIAFQFSHHIVQADGTVEHKGEYLNTAPCVFPNYAFLRKLKEELEGDQGTIFKYSSHENTYLNMIYDQLRADEAEIEDREELCAFIREITYHRVGNEKIEGSRNMVDLYDLVKRYYYDQQMKGSNSIKAVLPAILNSSTYIQEKYSQPIYGAKDEIKSLNFTDWTWVQFEEGHVIDPYSLLPQLFEEDAAYDVSHFDMSLSDGGAAMSAYARLQFTEVHPEARKQVENGLLKYCELDTLAMVMIYEAWKDMVK